MTNKDIYILVDKYFEGKTNSEEEKLLRTQISKAEIPKDLDYLIPIFSYFDEETKSLNSQKEKKRIKITPYLKWIAAACLAVIFVSGILFVLDNHKHSNKDSFAYVDGVRITNIDEIKDYSTNSFNLAKSNNQTIENQLSIFLNQEQKNIEK